MAELFFNSNFVKHCGIVCLLLIGIAGCQPASRPRVELSNTASRADNLNTAITELQRLSDTENDVARGFHYLNQWAEQGGTDIPGWEPDPLLKTFPSNMAPLVEQANFRRKDFPLYDYNHINEAIWTREAARWISQKEAPVEFQPWLEKVGKERGIDVQEQLRAALNLFDWSIRNIRLEKMLPPPPPPVAGASDSLASARAPLRGEPGPGYTKLPLQILIQSRGDAWQRAWMFLLLARQAGIPGVMLGIRGENSIDEPQAWCPALLIDGQLYLFEAELGLPFRNEDGTQVATWEELFQHPEWLRRFDLQGLADYPIQASDLKRVVALVPATPEALSVRMLALERSLKGDQHLQLTAPTKEIVAGLSKMPGIQAVQLWTIPWDAVIYSSVFRAKLANDQQARVNYQLQYGMYELWTPIMQARQRHIRGIFETVDQTIGARDLYIASRVPNRMQSLTAIRSKEEAKAMAYAKEDATFFLAITLYEEGKFDLSEEWFHDRIIEGAPDSPWLSAARYNLGRCYEAEGEFEKARDQYLVDTESVQRHGNILRAGLLRERMKHQDKPTEEKPSEEKPSEEKPAEEPSAPEPAKEPAAEPAKSAPPAEESPAERPETSEPKADEPAASSEAPADKDPA